MPYKREHYNAVLDAIVKAYSLDPLKIPDWQWAAWRSAIKRFFDKEYSIKEIVSAIEEAGEKRQWPLNTALFHRLEDVILKNRREHRSTSIAGMHKIGSIISTKP